MIKISAALICFNEQANIKRCLHSVGWCDEIVVVDSGSDDDTVGILHGFAKVKLFIRSFDDFAAQKNFAVQKCSNEWVLSIDADEEVTGELAQEILGLDFTCNGYFISRQNSFLGKWIYFGGWSPDYKLRLFNRKNAVWRGAIHETLFLE
ncbi:MAG: glycosyltransferase family 2 protein, partial [bacterium]